MDEFRQNFLKVFALDDFFRRFFPVFFQDTNRSHQILVKITYKQFFELCK